MAISLYINSILRALLLGSRKAIMYEFRVILCIRAKPLELMHRITRNSYIMALACCLNQSDLHGSTQLPMGTGTYRKQHHRVYFLSIVVESWHMVSNRILAWQAGLLQLERLSTCYVGGACDL
jgi:hypothetical protein